MLNADTTNMTVLISGNSANTSLVANNSSTGKSLDIQSNGTSVFSITNVASAEGSALFKNRTNNTTAFQIQSSGAIALLTADTLRRE